MSSILLSNPFVAPPPPLQTAGAEQHAAAASVAPVRGASGSANTQDTAGYGGENGRNGSDSRQHAFLALTRAASAIGRPSDATPGSIVTALAQSDETGVIVPFGSNLPDFEMPDILPTAPWFKDN